jgi:hypothetical protein
MARPPQRQIPFQPGRGFDAVRTIRARFPVPRPGKIMMQIGQKKHGINLSFMERFKHEWRL